MNRKAIVIGSGFAGLSAATNLTKKGFDVIILEKNDQPGGRARSFFVDGYTFDMGPSWYWMPDVFEKYFEQFGKKVSDYYNLVRLDPSYRVYFDKGDALDLEADLSKLASQFENIEKGSGKKLLEFLEDAAYKYQVGINDLVYKPGRSITEYADTRVLKGLLQLNILRSMRKHVSKYFTNSKLIKLMEFPILFLGGTPSNTPALYSLMNYADMALGTWYPIGGMHQIVKAMVSLAEENGVEIKLSHNVKSIKVSNGKAVLVSTDKGDFEADVIVGAADYHHVEQNLLPKEHRQYSEKYWKSRKMAPSSLLFYLGVNKRVENIKHHTLFFDENFDEHAAEIYENPQWPSKPLFYVCTPSKTDDSVAPKDCENMFLLMPVAPGLEDNEEIREHYFEIMINRLEEHVGERIKENIVVKKSYAQSNFVDDYNAFRGNAYGLANTLKQTAILKPSMKSNKVENLYYAGQLTVPGPGVPPSIISGHVVAGEIAKDLNIKELV
ncbi:phytoene desaturase family protein [Owenweeksia hongkongensis]|uniref:phytoene desaturase family protein n=1 Tax=Owenweeksia hongkongensis TaxID=253245 RepID=UPI003A8F501E